MNKIQLTNKVNQLNKFFTDIFNGQNKKYIKRKRLLTMENVFNFMCYKSMLST